jgi:hypothetical protein
MTNCYVARAISIVKERLVTECIIAHTTGSVTEGLKADGSAKSNLLCAHGSGGKPVKGLITHGSVGACDGIALKGLRSDGDIRTDIISLDVTDCAAGGVTEKRKRAIRCVASDIGVAQERSGTSSRILVTSVKKERPGPNSGVEVAGSVASQRQKTNCRVVRAAGETEKGALSFRRIASWIAAVRRRADRPSCRAKREEANREGCKN